VLRRGLCFILLPVLMSGVIELLQEYATLYRSGDWRDLAANTLGVLMGAAWGAWWLPWWMKRRNGAKSGGGASK
ncbi:MAG: VanZ family protein, partial [Bacteroidaceae bacterium]|nr:VanZ family protein [Bacteroidaceae bacterium]